VEVGDGIELNTGNKNGDGDGDVGLGTGDDGGDGIEGGDLRHQDGEKTEELAARSWESVFDRFG
jgi:hypothetical protein